MRGQSLVIFAISAVVLFGICGLAIDTGLSYLAANQVERAAAAGALAGVTYMPDQYSPNAINAAKAAVQRNGYPNAQVTVFRVPKGCGSGAPCLPNRLGVDVTTTVNNTFIRLLGFGPSHTVTQEATAEYLSTLTLGQPGAQIGSTQSQINASPQQGFYFLRTEGWGTPRTEGDAYTPNPASNGPSTDLHTISGELGTEVSSLPAGWTPFPQPSNTKDCGGYDFQIAVPTTETAGTVHLEVYNPGHFPDSGNTYKENDSTFNSGTAAQYDTMVYTLFQENDRFDRTSDTPKTQLVVNPVNATNGNQAQWQDVTQSGTSLLKAATTAAFYQQWVDIGLGAYSDLESIAGNHLTSFHGTSSFTLSPGQTYRLRVDTYDGSKQGCSNSTNGTDSGGGHKGYAVRVTDQPDGNPSPVCAACTLGGLNELAFYTPLTASGSTTVFDVPMVNVPAVYAGQTINIYAYDPGDVSGTNYIDIMDPCPSSPCPASPGSIATDPNIKVYDLGVNKATVPTSSLYPDSAHWPSQGTGSVQARVLTHDGSGNPYNGHWLLFKVPVPTTYAPTTAAQQYWSLQYELTGGTATDTLTMSVGFDGPPVHLVPNT